MRCEAPSSAVTRTGGSLRWDVPPAGSDFFSIFELIWSDLVCTFDQYFIENFLEKLHFLKQFGLVWLVCRPIVLTDILLKSHLLIS